jgi:hypothetical protein
VNDPGSAWSSPLWPKIQRVLIIDRLAANPTPDVPLDLCRSLSSLADGFDRLHQRRPLDDPLIATLIAAGSIGLGELTARTIHAHRRRCVSLGRNALPILVL